MRKKEMYKMMRIITFALITTTALVSCKGKMQKKGFVVEVQSHQQALKSANPITDLEQTISRGMNDPYTDPRFVMNQINEEFFGNALKNNMNAGTPLVENSLHNRELMAFRNLPMNLQGVLGMNSLAGNLPSNPITQHAIKENNVAFRQPVQSIDQALSNLMKFKTSMAAKKHVYKSKAEPLISPYDIAKSTTDPRLPSDVKIAHMSTDVIHPSAAKQEASNSRSLPTREREQSLESSEQADPTAQNIIDSPQKTSEPINIGETQNVGDSLSSIIEKNGPKSNDILATNPGSISGREMEDNFSSIKAFIDADDVLRTKKVIDPVRNPLEELMHSKHKKHTVPKVRKTLKKIIVSK